MRKLLNSAHSSDVIFVLLGLAILLWWSGL